MKNLYKLSLISVITVFVCTSACVFNKYHDVAVKELGDYIYLKTYNLEFNTDDHEVSYVFTKNTQYKFVFANDVLTEDVKMVLYDNNRNEICSNYVPKMQKMYNKVGFNCTATGVYYITFNFVNPKKTKCASVALGFKKL